MKNISQKNPDEINREMEEKRNDNKKGRYYMLNENDGEPDKVARVKKVKTNIQEEKLLTQDEIKKLLDACKSSRDSSLIAILSESGCRIFEALNLHHSITANTNCKDLVRHKIYNVENQLKLSFFSRLKNYHVFLEKYLIYSLH